MSKPAAGRFIKLRGVRHNNLKNLNLDLPTGKLIVITGLSGSGKSSLAFDTLFAEGQRRYVETFSPYARQFMDRMDKPQVDSIEGIPPAIAIEQRNSVKSTRSTIGTMTEINDYIKVVWPSLSKLYCHQCGALVEKESSNKVWDKATARWNQVEVLVVFKLPLSDKFGFAACLDLLQKQGYQRVLIENDVLRISDLKQDSVKSFIRVVQDRVKISKENKSRFLEACEQAYHFGKGQLCLHLLNENGKATEGWNFSSHLHCPKCDIEFKEPSPALFNFNHPVGACPACRGFGRIITLDYQLAIPDPSLSLAKGVVKPWQTGQGEESHQDMLKFAKKRGIPTNIPFLEMKAEDQKWLIEGDPGYGQNGVEWPTAWYGIKGYFRWLESKAYKMHVRVLLARYRSYVECPECKGKRFQPATLRFKASVPGSNEQLTIADFQQLSVGKALQAITAWRAGRKHNVKDPVSLGLGELEARLGYLKTAGLEYLTLDRPTRSLSGGETERVNLTTCLGSRLVNTLFVLDEPSVGLHPRDTDRLIAILTRLRDAGNTVVVVEHEASVMAAADEIIDLGPGHGESGGAIVFQGTYTELLKSRRSLTGAYLNKEKQAALPHEEQQIKEEHWDWLRIENVNAHNLKAISVAIPKNKFVCVTGVSGSGKTTLIREALFPNLVKLIAAAQSEKAGADDTESEEAEMAEDHVIPVKISGYDNLHSVIMVDQSAIGRTPRSNPAV
ncbi:MAG: UvrABC system protein [Verrucomicrobiales bacterium]|nr:UvrABC system protein [Verrucomicrobiales bacterium]